MLLQIEAVLVIEYPIPIYIQASFASGWKSMFAVPSQPPKL